MKIYKLINGILIESERLFYLLNEVNWDHLLNQDNLRTVLKGLIKEESPVDNAYSLLENTLLAPIQSQEVWASGVTYYRSRTARMEESETAGGSNFYDKVYEAERPELFFKATPARTVASGGKVNIRKDSSWDVPEPELTLFINAKGKIVGYTIGNDMSSRSIEGENPLYLPQAKTYDACAGLGPCIYVPEKPLSSDTEISMRIKRNGKEIFSDSIPLSQMKRKPEELVEFLFRECSFPQGCFLMTGTGIVPPNDYSAKSGDEVYITIAPIGTLTNIVN